MSGFGAGAEDSTPFVQDQLTPGAQITDIPNHQSKQRFIIGNLVIAPHAAGPETELAFSSRRASVHGLPIIVNQHRQQRFALSISVVILCAVGPLAAVEATLPPAATNAVVRSLVVKDVHGKVHQPLADAGQKATVLLFLMHDCPLANTCAPEINRIVADYTGRGVRSFVVYVEEELSPRAARKHAKDYGFTYPALLDRGQALMKLTGATVSPEAAVLGPDNALLYRGRIDDRLIAFGKQRVTPTRRDLREALDEILAGKPVSSPATKAVGCYLPAAENAKKAKRSNSKSE